MSTPSAGEIGVVRNGRAWYNPFDWIDNHNIRGTVDNGKGSTWVGMGSDVHYYPVDSQQRFFKMESCGGDPCDGADAPAVTVPTSDGVEVTISGTFYLNTVFNNSPQGIVAVKAFDNQFSTRTFGGKHPFEGANGWSNFLTAIVSPVVQNNLRDIVAGTRCSQLVSSCALVQNQGGSPQNVAQDNRKNITDIQTKIEKGLADDLKTTLGGREFFNRRTIRFKLSSVGLPVKIQDAINDAQSAFAQVSQAQAKVQSARADAEANRQRQSGYQQCPACATIDALKAIPDSVTTFAPGSGFSITGK